MKVSEAKKLLEGLPDNLEVKLEILRAYGNKEDWVVPNHNWYPKVPQFYSEQGGQHIGPVIW